MREVATGWTRSSAARLAFGAQLAGVVDLVEVDAILDNGHKGRQCGAAKL
jgi:hypothetical protein